MRKRVQVEETVRAMDTKGVHPPNVDVIREGGTFYPRGGEFDEKGVNVRHRAIDTNGYILVFQPGV